MAREKIPSFPLAALRPRPNVERLPHVGLHQMEGLPERPDQDLTELRRRIENEFRALDPGMFHRAVESFPKRFEKCLIVDGRSPESHHDEEADEYSMPDVTKAAFRAKIMIFGRIKISPGYGNSSAENFIPKKTSRFPLYDKENRIKKYEPSEV